MMRKLVVVPLGSNNITMDLCSLQISRNEAEEIKITRGYKSGNNEIGTVDTDTVNNIINARMNEILQNVKYQIEESNENIGHMIFTGGGSKLKNLELLLDEYLPNYKCEIISEPKFSLVSNSGVNLNGIFSTALYSLLKLGNENCCEVLKPATYTPPVEQQLQFDYDQNTEVKEEKKTEESPKNEEKKNEKKGKDRKTPWQWIKQGTLEFIGQITEEESDDNDKN